MSDIYIGEAKVPLTKEQLVSFVNMCDGHSLFGADHAAKETGAELGAFVSLSETVHNTKELHGPKGALYGPDGNEVDSIENSIYGLSALRSIANQLGVKPSEMAGRGFAARDLQARILKKVEEGYESHEKPGVSHAPVLPPLRVRPTKEVADALERGARGPTVRQAEDFDAVEWVDWFHGLMDSLKIGGVWATSRDYISPFVLEKVSHPDPSRPNGKPRTTAGRVRVKSGELDERTAAVIEASDYILLSNSDEDTDDDGE